MCAVLFLRLFSSRYLILRNTQSKKAEELPISRSLTPSFQVIFHVICLFNRNEYVTKNNRWQKFGISQENVYEGVSFSTVTKLQPSDGNFAIKIAHHRYFLEYVPKTSYFKKQYFEKKVYGGSAC